jgi:hypothetical protein
MNANILLSSLLTEVGALAMSMSSPPETERCTDGYLPSHIILNVVMSF